jgi:hypothetical protein
VRPLLGTLSISLALAAAPVFAEERFALIIGSNAGWENDRPLRHAESDADRVAAVLVELGKFPADHVQVLHDPNTTEVRERLKKLSATTKAHGDATTLVFVYYSGHADGTSLHLKGPPLGFDELSETMRDIPATVRIGVFDACRSGTIATKGGAPTASFDVKVVDELTVRGLALLTSSGADELSQEQRALQGSVFTHHFLSGLRGAADLDHNGQVTLAESYQYAFQRTEADTAATIAPQRPAFRYEMKGQGDLVMTWPESATASLLLASGPGQRYVVVDEKETLVVAEGRSDAERELDMALAPGRYLVKEVLKDQFKVAALTLKDGAHVRTSSLTFTPRPMSAGLVKGFDLLAAVKHPRRAFWFVAAGALATGAAWAIAGGQNLALRNSYSSLPRPLTSDESASLTGWALGSDIAMGLTAALALTAVLTW